MRGWAPIRAALITLVIAVALLDGCPMPAGPKERARVASWYGATGMEVIDRLDHTRLDLLRPLRPLLDGARLHQRWNLFAGASRQRFRMVIETQAGDRPWQLRYRALDDEHAFRADALAYRRVRGGWNPRRDGPRGAYPAFATWVANQLFATDPTITLVRVRMETIEIGPRGGYRATGAYVHEQVRARPAPRGAR